MNSIDNELDETRESDRTMYHRVNRKIINLYNNIFLIDFYIYKNFRSYIEMNIILIYIRVLNFIKSRRCRAYIFMILLLIDHQLITKYSFNRIHLKYYVSCRIHI